MSMDVNSEEATVWSQHMRRISRMEYALKLALADLEQTYCHVSSVSADRIKSVTIPAIKLALSE